MSIITLKYNTLYKSIILVLICLFIVSDSAFALAPSLASKPILETDGSFRNRWLFTDISYLIGQILVLAREQNLQDPKNILIPLIRKHIREKNGEAEMLLENFDIDGIEEIREGGVITGFSLPVKRAGAPAYRLVYNLQDGDTVIPIKDKTNVYIKVDISVAADLTRSLITRIRESGGKITFEEFQHIAASKGYYEKGLARFGVPSTDGITFKTDASPGVARAFARQFYGFWEEMGKPGIFNIVEQGGGDGSMALHILDTIKTEEGMQDLYSHIQYTIIDISESWSKKQRQLLHSRHPGVRCVVASVFEMPFENESIEGVFFSNELPDAFPVHRVVMRNGVLKEIYVTYDNGEFKEVEAGLSTDKINDYFELVGKLPPEGKEIAVNLYLFTWMKEVNRVLKRGFVVTSDYGFEKTQIRYDSAHKEAVWNLTEDPKLPILTPGIDITHNVDFETLDKIAMSIGLKHEHLGSFGTFLTIFSPASIPINDEEYVLIHSKMISGEIDKSSIAHIFPKADYLTYLIIYMTGGAMVAYDRESKEVGETLWSLHQRLDVALEKEFIRRQLSSSDNVRDFYLWFAQLIKDNLGTARDLLSSVQYPRHKRTLAQGVPFAESFVNGIEMLLDESGKQVNINNTLEGILDLTFSQYYANRSYKYAISKQLSPDIPTIYARQDEIAYLLLSLILSLREMREVNLTASTQLTSDKGIKYITVEMTTSQEMPLSNAIVDKKDTGIGFELAKGIAQSYGGTIDVRSEAGKGTTLTVRLPVAAAAEGQQLLTAVEPERTQATNLQDILTYIQAQPQSQPIIIALGTSWIKGYEKGRSLQYNALNPLIASLRTYCEARGIPLIVDDDDKLLAHINTERAKEGKYGAKVVVLAGKDTAASDDFAPLRNDGKNAFVVGIDNQELTADSYIRLMEMLTIALKLSVGLEISLDNAHITITKDNEHHIYIFLPHAEPMDYERLKSIYRVQEFA